MTKGDFVIVQDAKGEGAAILQVFRLLTPEEQRIACAILDGMRLQKQLDTQRKKPNKTAEESEAAQ